MKWLLIAGGILACCILIPVLIGLVLPVKHSARVEGLVPAGSGQVWKRITDAAGFPGWRKGLDRVEVMDTGRWIEISGSNKLPMRIVESLPVTRLVTRIDSDKLPFGGQWTFRLEPQGGSTQVTIIEDGEVYNPFFRFVSRFIMGHHATLNRYMTDLETSFRQSRRSNKP